MRLVGELAAGGPRPGGGHRGPRQRRPPAIELPCSRTPRGWLTRRRTPSRRRARADPCPSRAARRSRAGPAVRVRTPSSGAAMAANATATCRPRQVFEITGAGRGTPIAKSPGPWATARRRGDRACPSTTTLRAGRRKRSSTRSCATTLEAFLAHARESYERGLPHYVEQAFRAYLTCGVFAHGFLRLHCDACHRDLLVAFTCQGRGVCPSCASRRMANSAAHIVDRVLPAVPVRQWVLSLPFELRRLAAFRADVTRALGRIFIEAVALEQKRSAGIVSGRHAAANHTQRFGGSLNLNLHFHAVFADGVFAHPPRNDAGRAAGAARSAGASAQISARDLPRRAWAALQVAQLGGAQGAGGRARSRPSGERQWNREARRGDASVDAPANAQARPARPRTASWGADICAGGAPPYPSVRRLSPQRRSQQHPLGPRPQCVRSAALWPLLPMTL